MQGVFTGDGESVVAAWAEMVVDRYRHFIRSNLFVMSMRVDTCSVMSESRH